MLCGIEEARRIGANVAKLAELLVSPSRQAPFHIASNRSAARRSSAFSDDGLTGCNEITVPTRRSACCANNNPASRSSDFAGTHLSTTGGEEMHQLVTNEAPSGLLTLNSSCGSALVAGGAAVNVAMGTPGLTAVRRHTGTVPVV
jgi:hypothetical protein